MSNNRSTIVHISDPHFGTEDRQIVNVLLSEINSLSPELVVISGDLTQRALNKQFKKAKDFITKINSPKIVIPGNHDIPLYNLFKRYFSSFDKYKRFIYPVKYPEHKTDKLVVVGVNTSTPFRSQSGRIKEEDIEYLKKYFALIEPTVIKGVVVHHNIIPYSGLKGSSVLGNNEIFLKEMNDLGVNLIFAGHLHKSTTKSYKNNEENKETILLQAGTCISKRLRHEENTFLIIKTDKQSINITSKVYNGSKFISGDVENYNRKFAETTREN